MKKTESDYNGDEVAIVGMAGRFPGADDLEQLWSLLRKGEEAVSTFTDAELLQAGVDAADLQDPNYVRAKAVLEGIELFAAEFFGVNPKEAALMDPQHRLLLETAYAALEDAGHCVGEAPRNVGVFSSVSLSNYLLFNILPQQERLKADRFLAVMGNNRDFVSSRIAYKLNLNGPSVAVQTACSSSLVAVHMACQALLNGECETALVGGASVKLPQKSGYHFQEGGILSPDGHCRAFDAEAQGSVVGEGVGAVVLKTLEDALEAGDEIHALIKGSATNNDGSARVGFTAPSVSGQAAVVRAALAVAGVGADTIDYVEAHGTATPLGDPIELAGLRQAFGPVPKARCALGSLKTNIGHLDAAAGIAGLIKTVLSLKKGMIPPSLNFDKPNPEADMADTPFYVNAALRQWPRNGHPRRAGVSSFGLGGANAHLVVEEAPPASNPPSARPYQLLVMSAKTDSALEKVGDNLAAFAEREPGAELSSIAYTLQVGRAVLPHGRIAVARDGRDAAACLRGGDPRRVFSSVRDGNRPSVAFMFPGLGDQYVNMGLGLYETEKDFAEQVDRCAELLRPHLGLDLRRHLFAPDAAQRKTAAGPGGATLDLRAMLEGARAGAGGVAGELAQTRFAQPAMFVVEYALARLWQKWGIEPEAMIGYSIGEYVAACLAGVFSLEDALFLVAKRAQMIEAVPQGAMLAVSLPAEQVVPLIGAGLSLAAVNSPELCVVAGSPEDVSELERVCAERRRPCRRLATSHAFHSEMMRGIAGEFSELVGSVRRQAPAIPFASNVSGDWIAAEEATDPDYWARHLCQTVQFAEGVRRVGRDGRVLLEVGPGSALGSMAMQNIEHGSATVLNSLGHAHEGQDDAAVMALALGKLWLSGAAVDWAAYNEHEPRRKVALPSYPFERERYWIEPPGRESRSAARGARLEFDRWFHTPSWKQAPMPSAGAGGWAAATWLVCDDGAGFGQALRGELERLGQEVVQVSGGAGGGDDGLDKYDVLFRSLRDSDRMPDRIVHCPTASGGDEGHGGRFYELMRLVQALGEWGDGAEVRVGVVTDAVHSIIGAEEPCPGEAALPGLCKVVSQEYPHIRCKAVDVQVRGAEAAAALAERLVGELSVADGGAVVAYRGANRWTLGFEPVALPDPGPRPARFRRGGVYVITGGLGGLGHVFAEYLVAEFEARLVLVSRSGLPAGAADGRTAVRAENVRRLRDMGAEVEVVAADVADAVRMREVVEETLRRYGEINGVIHAAGLPGAGLIQLKSEAAARGVLAPKVQGALALEWALEGVDLDFLALVSSKTAIEGGIGQVDYCFANSYLDAFARHYSARRGVRAFSVNWDAWQWNDWRDPLADALPTVKERDEQRRRENGITASEGVRAFARVLASDLPQVVVSTSDLGESIARHNSREIGDLLEEAEREVGPRSGETKARPVLQVEFAAPNNETEKLIAEIWQDLLGIEEVGIHDNFFHLGGHSLIGLQLMARLQDAFGVDPPLQILFKVPTVAELALAVEELLIEEAGRLDELDFVA